MTAHRIVGGRYELLRPVGRGGMGEVWQGRDTRLDRDVAVKLLRPSVLPAHADVEALAVRFAREARLTAKLENPGVPAVYDTGTDNDDLYLVMQLIGGADLAEFQAENEPVPVGWVAAIGAQIAAVLGAAHAAGLIHRDLKPRNVMITHSGEVKVLDFGIAVLRDADVTRITRSAESVGTPAYMAPEQAMHGTASPSSDLYSLGCVLYELLTGRHVFEGGTPLATMHRHYTETPAPVLQLRPDTQPVLADLVTRLLAKRQDQRPANAAEVYDVLLTLLPKPANGAKLPMDPTRPFRDQLSIPPRPAPVVVPQHPTPPVPQAQQEIRPRIEATDRYPHRLDTPGRRIGEGTLLTFGVLVAGLEATEALDGSASPDPAAGVAIGVAILLLGLWLRKRRLDLPRPWTIRFGRRAAEPTPSGRLERILERVLLIMGGMMTVVYAVCWLLDVVGVAAWTFTTGPAGGIFLGLMTLLPGVLMRQRRLGRPYPWSF
ncbi:MAG: serine/threonine-protein kinase [Kibdelosporangium sp.]